MKNKLKLVLWGKNLQLPMDYDNLEFDDYKLINNNGYELNIYKNNKMIKLIYYWENGKLWHECNYKNGKENGKHYVWWGKTFMYEKNYKNGVKINEK